MRVTDKRRRACSCPFLPPALALLFFGVVFAGFVGASGEGGGEQGEDGLGGVVDWPHCLGEEEGGREGGREAIEGK